MNITKLMIAIITIFYFSSVAQPPMIYCQQPPQQPQQPQPSTDQEQPEEMTDTMPTPIVG